MRLDQGEELHTEPELRPEIRSAEGERLDAARAEFRAEWQAKIDRKRQQAESARRREVGWDHFCDWFYLRGIALGGGLGGLAGLILKGLLGALILAAGGALAVGVIGVPLLVLGLGCKAWFGMRAQRLEQELLELGRVELPREALPDRLTPQDVLLAFPAEWRAKAQETLRQAKSARRRERWWNAATWKVFCTGASTSVLLGLIAAAQQNYALATALTVCSALLTIPLLCLASFGEWHWKKRAEHLERELQELELSEPER
jgi:hypothetical protein